METIRVGSIQEEMKINFSVPMKEISIRVRSLCLFRKKRITYCDIVL